MGYGLVKVPKHFWSNSSIKARLNNWLFYVSVYSEEKNERIFELEKYVQILNHWENYYISKTPQCDELVLLDRIKNHIPEEVRNEILTRGKHNQEYRESNYIKKMPTKGSLVNLNQITRSKYYSYQMTVLNWERAVIESYYYKDLNDSKTYSVVTADSRIYADKPLIVRIFPCIENFYFRVLMCPIDILIAIVVGLLSLTVLFSEITGFLTNSVVWKYIFGIILHHHMTGVYTVLCMSAVFIVYMATICYISIFAVKLFGFYGFWPRATDSVTLLNSALYISKMTPPLLYNFLIMFFKYEDLYRRTDFFVVS